MIKIITTKTYKDLLKAKATVLAQEIMIDEATDLLFETS
jgi:hypothetical protein